MADEDMMEMDDLGEAAAEGAAEGGGNPLFKYLPLIGGVLVVQVIIIYFAVQWFMPDDAPQEEAKTEKVAEQAEGAETNGEAFEPPPTSVATVFDQLEVIVVNPAGTEGLRFLSIQVFLGLSSMKVEAFITSNNLVPRINDTLVTFLSSKTIVDLDPGKHPKLKEEIKTRLNRFLGQNAVLEVYFQSFVLQ